MVLNLDKGGLNELLKFPIFRASLNGFFSFLRFLLENTHFPNRYVHCHVPQVFLWKEMGGPFPLKNQCNVQFYNLYNVSKNYIYTYIFFKFQFCKKSTLLLRVVVVKQILKVYTQDFFFFSNFPNIQEKLTIIFPKINK